VRTVLFIDGRYVDTFSPGQYAFWKGPADARVIEVDQRETTADVSGQEIMTADKVTLRVNANVTYRIVDARKTVSQADDARQALYRETQLALYTASARNVGSKCKSCGATTMRNAILLCISCLVAADGPDALAQQTEAAKLVVWNLDRLDLIGGHKTEVLGRPILFESPNGKAIRFNGSEDALFISTNPLSGLVQFTAEVIFQPLEDGPKEQRFLHFQEDGSENRLLFETRITADNRWFLDTFLKSGDGNFTLFAERSLHPIGPWYHAAVTMDGKTMRHFVNGIEELSTPVKFTPQAAGRTSIGVRINRVHWFKGAVRQIRISPKALAPAEFLKP
jgi:Concanavalin A-like lectin/glucanases superfamily/SPFH domain / Band 7 family